MRKFVAFLGTTSACRQMSHWYLLWILRHFIISSLSCPCQWSTPFCCFLCRSRWHGNNL